MTPHRRNLWIWAGVVLVAIFLWWHVARSRIHMVNELAFLVLTSKENILIDPGLYKTNTNLVPIIQTKNSIKLV